MKRKRHNGHWNGWFYDETYRSNIDVIWPVNLKQVDAFVKWRYGIEPNRNEQPTFGAKYVEITKSNGMQANIICLAEWPRIPDATDYSFVAHECFHATDHILARRGLPLQSYVSSEAYAFLLESIVRRVLTLLDTRRKISE